MPPKLSATELKEFLKKGEKRRQDRDIQEFQTERHSKLFKGYAFEELKPQIPPQARNKSLMEQLRERETKGGRTLVLRAEDRRTPEPMEKITRPPKLVRKSRVMTSMPAQSDYFNYVENAARNNPPPPPPAMKKGGIVKKTGIVLVHKGELVVPAGRVASVQKAVKKAGLKPLKK